MNLTILARMLGLILILIGLALGICFLVAAIEAHQGRQDHGMAPMGYSCLVTLFAGGLLVTLGRKAAQEELLRKEAVAIAGLGWILASLFGSLPFVLFEDHLSVIPAFFESMSGFTTTGSTVLRDVETLPDAILLWRALSQWIGGLGILSLLVVVLSAKGVPGKSMIGAESSLNLSESSFSRMRDLVLRMWIVYGCLTATCWLGLWLIGRQNPQPMSGFHALLYSLTTVSTGGFAPHNASVGYFNSSAIENFLCLFMLVSSLSVLLIVNLVWGNYGKKAGRAEAIGFAGLIAFGVLAITVDLWLNHESEGWTSVRHALFPVISLSSSTGFGTEDYDQWPLMAQCVLYLLMAIGGCSGSTAGGIKVVRLLVFLSVIRKDISNTFRPNRIFSLKIDGRTVETETQTQVLSHIALVGMIVLFSTLVIAAFEPSIVDLNTAFGSVFATFFNMGPGFGSVGPTDNFSHFHQSTLLFLSLLMLLGRLEVFVLLALFSKELWKRY